MIVSILFYVFAAVLVVAALGVITARNPVHCALFLVVAFLNSAVIWLLLGPSSSRSRWSSSTWAP